MTRRGCACGGRMHSRFTHFWQRMTARGLSVEVTYFHGDDRRESKCEFWLDVPAWVWRPRCWIKGHSQGPDWSCVYCHAPMAARLESEAGE